MVKKNKNSSSSLVVVNDDPAQVFFFTRILKLSGFDVQGFQSAQEALQVMSAASTPDLIITDLNMPGMDGWRFCRTLRSPRYSSLNSVPVLVVSATFAGDDTFQTVADLGANAFMSAPVDPDAFVRKVHSMLDGDFSLNTSWVLLAAGDQGEAGKLKTALQDHGYIAGIAGSGEEALNQFRRNNYDVAVLEDGLPDMAAEKLLENFLGERSRTVCIMVTEDPSLELPVKWITLGASAFIRKPFSPLYLVELCASGRRERAFLKMEELLEKRTRALQESEQRYRSLFQNNHTAMLIIDPQTADIVDANAATCSYYGWTRNELTSKKISQLNILSDQEVFDEMKKAVNEGRDQFYFQHCLADGQIRDVEVFSGPIVLQGRTLLYSIIHDITRRKQVEKELLQSNADLKAAEAIAHMGSWKYDPLEDRFTASEGFFRILGNKSVQQPSFSQILDAVHADDKDLLGNEKERVLRTYESFDFEFRIVVRNTVRWIRAMGAAQTSLNGHSVFLMGKVMDVSEKKELELKEKQQQEHLAQASKMAALGTLVAGVAHEINNPNNLIMLNAPILEKVWNDALPVLKKHYQGNKDFELAGTPFTLMCDYAVRLFSGINEGSKRISNIISELKDFARQSSLDMSRQVNINEVADSALTLMSKTISRHTDDFSVSLQPDLPLIRGDFQKLEQVLVNLLINACQSLADKTRSISMETFYDPENNFVAIRITDEGQGIPRENLDRICDPFFSTRQQTGGTGLGLSISSGIVQDHDGVMSFDSEPGQGTTVTVFLKPITQPACPRKN
ncbi:MAG: response regulator [Desulfonatronovibrio sp.]